MFIVVSNNGRIPSDLEGFQVEQWSAEEFLERAMAGMEVDEGIWYDVNYLSEELYEGLKEYKEAGVNLVYYRFSDTPNINFKIDDEIKVYDINPPKKEEPIQEESIKESESSEPIVESTQTNEQSINVQQQIESQIQTNNQSVIQQPQVQTQPTSQQQVVQQSVQNQQPIQQPVNTIQQDVSSISQIPGGIKVADSNISQDTMNQHINKAMFNMLQYDDYDASTPQANRKAAPAKVILFGSSKGGTGKTFTCLISAYWYAKTHPTERIALADFDIIDGQIGITINKLTPTMNDFYKLAKGGHSDFAHLDNCKVKSDHFSPNIDFYLAPSQDIPEVTNDNEYWTQVFKLLITNYDVVFFDSGIDYLGKAPISQLYKIADKIIITCNPSINSVKSVIKQFKTLSGQRVNNVFRPGDDILSRTNVVLTRVYENQTINDIVVQNIVKFAPVIAAFGNIDGIISQVQWYQQWGLIDANPDITESLENITSI